MTQEEKQLLLKDLCARLPYGVEILADIEKEFDGGTIGQLGGILPYNGKKYDIKEPLFYQKGCLTPLTIEEIRPYLRPMSSMTEEEYKEFCKISGLRKKEEGNYFSNHLPEWGNSIITERVMVRTIDWLDAHHFDHHGLIEKELALEAPEGMYKF